MSFYLIYTKLTCSLESQSPPDDNDVRDIGINLDSSLQLFCKPKSRAAVHTAEVKQII